MRELKFRVWLKEHWAEEEHGTMLYDYQNTTLAEIGGFNPDELPIMQYTGLKDKNGKEIYEGDLLNLPDNPYLRGSIQQVYYYKDGFVTSSILFRDLEQANKNSLSWIINRDAIVIGNIHENPELFNQR